MERFSRSMSKSLSTDLSVCQCSSVYDKLFIRSFENTLIHLYTLLGHTSGSHVALKLNSPSARRKSKGSIVYTDEYNYDGMHFDYR